MHLFDLDPPGYLIYIDDRALDKVNVFEQTVIWISRWNRSNLVVNNISNKIELAYGAFIQRNKKWNENINFIYLEGANLTLSSKEDN